MHAGAVEGRPQRNNNGLQLDQIYDSMEQRCTASRAQSRGALIHLTRECLIYKTPFSPTRDDNGYEFMPLPSISRPGTRQDTETTNLRAPSAQTVDCRELQVALTRNGALTPNVCIRAQSAVNKQIEDVVRPLSRHCCDVLGSRHCYQCNQISRREKDLRTNTAKYPLLHLSRENVATIVTVERYIPDMNSYQIQHKIASGDISKPTCRERFIRAKSSSEERNVKPKEAPKKKLFRVLAKRNENIYFTNIRDLNSKIFRGELSKKISLKTSGKDQSKSFEVQKVGLQKKASLASFTEQICPMFVSPKKLKEPEKPLYVAYYEPPLLPKVCQNTEPSFFGWKRRKIQTTRQTAR